MKEKIKKIIFSITEIITVIWAIYGMNNIIKLGFSVQYFPEKFSEEHLELLKYYIKEESIVLLTALLFYFFSAILILYLLRKYERKN